MNFISLLAWDEIGRQGSQVLVLAFIIYWILRFLKGAPGLYQMFLFFLSIGILLFVADECKLTTIAWLLGKVCSFLPLILAILFTEEIRRIFSRFTELFRNTALDFQQGGTRYRNDIINGLCGVLEKLSASKTGALIAMEQSMDLEQFCRTGRRLDAELNSSNSLLETIFYKGTPLHDGGVIIRKGRIAAAACIFPVSKDPLEGDLGLRHRAAKGMSQKTDALIIVVSEETGAIHLALDGFLTTIVDYEQLKYKLEQYFSKHNRESATAWRMKLRKPWNKVKSWCILFASWRGFRFLTGRNGKGMDER